MENVCLVLMMLNAGASISNSWRSMLDGGFVYGDSARGRSIPTRNISHQELLIGRLRVLPPSKQVRIRHSAAEISYRATPCNISLKPNRRATYPAHKLLIERPRVFTSLKTDNLEVRGYVEDPTFSGKPTMRVISYDQC